MLVTQSCLTLCKPMDCSQPDFSVCGIIQARILEWVAYSFSRGSSRPRNRILVSCTAGRFFYRLSKQGSPQVGEEMEKQVLVQIPQILFQSLVKMLWINVSSTAAWPLKYFQMLIKKKKKSVTNISGEWVQSSRHPYCLSQSEFLSSTKFYTIQFLHSLYLII